jgi:hypothetical protein
MINHWNLQEELLELLMVKDLLQKKELVDLKFLKKNGALFVI